MKRTVILFLFSLMAQLAFSQMQINFEDIMKRAQAIKFSEMAAASAAQDTTAPQKHYAFHGKNLLTFSQISYSDSWESGGLPSITLRGASNLAFIYQKNLIYFQSVFDGAYAMTWESGSNATKKEDRFAFTNTFGLRTSKKSPFYYITMIDLKSQFAPGYQSATDRTIISRLFSPAYLTTSLGISYKYKDVLSVTMAPISGRFVFVLDTAIVHRGLYEVAQNETVKIDMGCYASVVYAQNFFKIFNFISKMELFSNYKDNPQNIDIDWENKLGIKITSYFTAEFYIRMVYKDKSRYAVPLADGTTELRGPRMQINESFNIGLTYAF
jgi:hypothetical protein